MGSPRTELSESTSNGSAERQASPAAATGKASCQVEGCSALLTNLKDYHSRYRICEFHSTTDHVIGHDGQLQRFCQQCGRFHLLTAFDGTKRSCRDGLARHNARRRRGAARRPQSTSALNVAAKSAQQPGLGAPQQATMLTGSWDIMGNTGSRSSPLFGVQHQAFSQPEAGLLQHTWSMEPELGTLSNNYAPMPMLPSVASVPSPPQLAPWQADACLTSPMLRSHDMQLGAARAQSCNLQQPWSRPAEPINQLGQSNFTSPVPPTADESLYLAGMSASATINMHRRPLSWPQPLSRAEAAPPPAQLLQAGPVGPTTASWQALDPDWGLICHDMNDEDTAMLELLCADAAPAPITATPRCPAHSTVDACLQNSSIRVLGENQSLQSLWENLQPDAARVQTLSHPNPANIDQCMELEPASAHPPNAAGVTAALTRGFALDADPSMTTMLSLPMDEAEQQLIMPGVFNGDALNVQEAAADAQPGMFHLDSFYGFIDASYSN